MGSAAADTVLDLGSRRIVFVGGKGGVGKTTTAASIAMRLAARGDRCLLVSTDPAHSLSDLLDRRIGDRPVPLAPNLWGMEIDPDAQVERHLDAVSERMRDLVKPEMYPEIDRQMQLARLAPGAVEAAMLERISALMIDSEQSYDRILFDTAPTGHTLRLMALPEIMAAWTDGLLRQRDRADSWDAAVKRFGPRPGAGDDLSFVDPVTEPEDTRTNRIRKLLLDRRRTFYQARRLLLDPLTTGFVVVLIPEKLPILESQKALDALEGSQIPVLGLVVNRVLPSEPLGRFLEQRRGQEAEYLDQIRERFSRYPIVYVPLMPRDVDGEDALSRFADHLLPPR